MPLRLTAILLRLAATMSVSLAQSPPGVRGILDPRRLTLGGQATFTIETTGAPAHSLPRGITADGLSINYGGHNTSIQIVNGQQSESYSYVYSVRATSAGRFTIPAVEVSVGGTVFTTEPQELVVEEVSGDPAVNRAPTPYFLELETPKTELYVGEVVPLKLTLYVVGRNTISGVGQPEMERENLVMKRFPTTPQSGAVEIGGRIFSTITLETSLFAIDAGEVTIGPCSIPAMYYESEEYARVPSIFRRANRSTFTSNTVKLNIKPLPEEDKPADFTGAVGTFELTQTASPTILETGDPISIDLEVSGVGNFDSLAAPVMTDAEGWQLYPPRELVQNLSDGITGGKITYSQVAIPLEPHREIPPFRFSYFDPRLGKYVTAKSDPVSIQVAPDASAAALQASAERPGMPPGYSPSPADRPVADYEDILTIIDEPPLLHTIASPLLRSPLFWVANTLPALAFLSLVGTSAHRRWRARQLEKQANPSPRTPAEILQAMRSPRITRRDFYRETLNLIDAAGHRDDPRLSALETAALGLLYASRLSNATAPVSPTESKAILEILEQVK